MIEEFYWLKSGYCKSIGALTNPFDKFKMRPYFAYFGLLKHRKLGWILFDTGYSEHYTDAVKKFPNRLLDILVPVTVSEEAFSQINNICAPQEVSFVILSHLHADHAGGLKQFTKAQIILHNEAYIQYKMEFGIKALKNAFMRELLPDNFEVRTLIINCNIPFNQVFMCKSKIDLFLTDVFGDKSMFLLKLNGHSPGMIGVLFEYNNQYKFLCSDALYHVESLINGKLGFAQKFIGGNKKDVLNTFNELIKLNREFPDWHIIPSHCDTAAELNKSYK
jgi:glyoxylase-like metal-dependent hydrolase (beta-lactamase superfamily II)